MEIYRQDFWRPLCCEDLPPALAIPLFDSAVNQGQGAAVEMLQASLEVATDGLMGPITVATARRLSKEQLGLTLSMFMARRGLRYSRFPRYGLGWLKRLFLFHQTALRFVTP